MISLEGLTLATGRHARGARDPPHVRAATCATACCRTCFPKAARDGALQHRRRDAVVLPRDRPLSSRATRRRDAGARAASRCCDDRSRTTCAARTSASASIPPTACSRPAPGYQLTWMDAKVDGWVVTPRRGKPVEIQALWYNALRSWPSGPRGSAGPTSTTRRTAERVARCVRARFWYGRRRPSVRRRRRRRRATTRACGRTSSSRSRSRIPCCAGARWRPVVERGRARLLTPYGLRTLAPGRTRLPAALRGQPRGARRRLPPGPRVAVAASGPSSTPGGGCTGTRSRRASVARAALLEHLRTRRGQRQRGLRRRAAAPAARLHRPGVERRRAAAGVAGDRAAGGTRFASRSAESVLRKQVAIGSRVRRGRTR